jgi:hypothetical protein
MQSHAAPPDGAIRLPVLGWKEEASLPEWGIRSLRVKLDTGARTSALHVTRVEIVGHHERDGEPLPVARLAIPLSRNDPSNAVTVETPIVGYKSVRDTRARNELRPVVRTRLVCGPLDRLIDTGWVSQRGGWYERVVSRCG